MLADTWILPMAVLAVAVAGCLQVSEQARGGDAANSDAPLELDAALPPTITLVPTTRPALDDFLRERKYLSFAAESRLHQSEGTHAGLASTFMNPLLYESLAANNREHPQGAAAVLELYKGGQQLTGWAVLVKVAPRGDAAMAIFGSKS